MNAASPVVARIVGIGHTAFTRASGRSVQALAAEAARSALRDAGLEAKAVGAVIPVGGSLFADDLISNLGLRPDVFDVLPAPGGNSGLAAICLAETVLAAQSASSVLIVFARNGSSANRISRRLSALPGQQFRTYLEQPHGWSTPAQWYSMIARRHMIEYGTTKSAMAVVALTMRAHAQLNPAAMMFGKTLTRNEYDAAPVISNPYQRYDCCLETDGAAAIVMVGAGQPQSGFRSRNVDVLAATTARPQSPEDLTNRRDWFDIGLSAAAQAGYARAGLGPADVDAAMVYDCFTFEVLHQLEEAGFCERGESSDFVESGAIGLGGRLPVNSHGGLLAEAHLVGLGHVLEAVRQLRREATGRQVDNARVVAVTGWGDWGDGSFALLSRSAA